MQTEEHIVLVGEPDSQHFGHTTTTKGLIVNSLSYTIYQNILTKYLNQLTLNNPFNINNSIEL